MKTHLRNLIPFSVLAGIFAFLFASLPASLAYVPNVDELNRDRQNADPNARGYRHDAKIESRIRAALENTDGLSDSAKDVKIIAVHGNIILKGTVSSLTEKARVEEIAKGTAKAALIENDLKVLHQ